MFKCSSSAKYAGLGAMVHYEKWLNGELVNNGFSGGEANSAIAVANSGRSALVLTALIDGHPYTAGIGRLLNRTEPISGKPLLGIRPKVFQYDTVTGCNYGRVIYNLGVGPVADEAFYQRGTANAEAGALLAPGDFDFVRLAKEDEVGFLHSGGIFACIGPNTAKLIIEGMRAVREAGGHTSYDLNVRPKLSRALVGGKHREIFDSIMPHVSLLFGNEEDLQEGLGIEGPSVHKQGATFEPEHFKPMAEEAVKRFPNIKAVVTSVRLVKRREVHLWGAYMWIDGQVFVVQPEEITVVDRIGGGDACGGSLVAALMRGEDPLTALRYGVIAGAACAGTSGDTLLTSHRGIAKAAGGAAARVER